MSEYAGDNFKKSLNEINKQLEINMNVRGIYGTHTNEYRDALKEEIRLLEQQKALLEVQI